MRLTISRMTRLERWLDRADAVLAQFLGVLPSPEPVPLTPEQARVMSRARAWRDLVLDLDQVGQLEELERWYALQEQRTA